MILKLKSFLKKIKNPFENNLLILDEFGSHLRRAEANLIENA
jgi:hypothetical protein